MKCGSVQNTTSTYVSRWAVKIEVLRALLPQSARAALTERRSLVAYKQQALVAPF